MQSQQAQRQRILVTDNLRVILFRSLIQGDALNFLYQGISEKTPTESSQSVLFLKDENPLDSFVKGYADALQGDNFISQEVHVGKYSTKTYTQGGLFIFLGKAAVSLSSGQSFDVSFGDLLSVRGSAQVVIQVTSAENQLFVLHFIEAKGLSKYRQMPLQQLEELAYATQIAYTPPLTEEQRPIVLRGIEWILEHPNLTEEERENITRSGRVKTCDNPNTPIGYDNVLLKSDAQLAFLPDGDKYYCLDKVVDLPEILRQGKNLGNMKPLTSEQISFLEEVQDQNPYPRIVTGDYFDEVKKYLQDQSEAEVPLYRRRAEELASLVSGVGLEYSAGKIFQFANDLSVEQYDEYLSHRSFRQEVEAEDRNDAAAEALGVLLRYYTQKRQISTQQGNLALMEIGKTVEEYTTMVQNKWDYSTLLSEMGVDGEVYWKPMRHYPDEEEEDLIREGQLAPSGGHRVGPWVIRFPDGNLYTEGSYDDQGYETGRWISYYQTGNKYSTGDYLQGDETGHWVMWHSNGTKSEEGDYLHGQRTGRWVMWYSNGNISSEGTYINGEVSGHWIEWYSDKIKKEEGDYLHGLKTGFWTFWHENGAKSSQGNYVEGEASGHWIEWYSNGYKKEEGDYLNDQKTGAWTFWHENGVKSSQGNYVEGDASGHWIEWYSNEIKKEEGDYINGQKTGRWIKWFPDGKKSSEGNYLNDQKTGFWTKWYGERGGPFETWYEDDDRKEEGTYLLGQKVGLWTEWSEFEKSQGNYLNGKKEGRWSTWDHFGPLLYEEIYENDVILTRETHTQDGSLVVTHYSNGLPVSLTEFYPSGEKRRDGLLRSNGNRNGIWVTYDKSGRKVQEDEYIEGYIIRSYRYEYDD